MDQPNRPDRRDPEGSDRGKEEGRVGGAGRGGRSGPPRGGQGDRPQRGPRPQREDRAPQDDRGPREDRPAREDRGGRPAAARRPASGRPTESRGARGTRDSRPWDERPRSGPPRAGGDRGGSSGGDRRPPRRDEPPRPGLVRKADEPPIPEGVDTRELHRAARAELRGLPKDLAEIVASHLVVAGQLIEEDPELAYAHAEAARRRAARLPLVREAAAETAYASGRWDVALSEYRALRRMTGTHDYLPVMADCERALGRPENALKLAREADRLELDPALRVEMTIVESGARRDLGQEAEARRLLQQAVQAQTVRPGLQTAVARLRYAYAETLLAGDERTEARRWFVAAAKLDPEQETDATLRVDEIDGLRIDFDETEDEVGDQDGGPAGDHAGEPAGNHR